MTYIGALDPNHQSNIDAQAAWEEFDEFMPGWQEREALGGFSLTEADFADGPSAADWDAFMEDNYVDPAERGI